ncbi:MAG TPA: membrane protein insertion efficiency factor YidD [Acidimicrobiales bacterium]
MTTASVDTAPSSPQEREGAAGRSLAGRALVVLVRLYQLVRAGRVSPCRFTPTCSTYAIEAVERHGALKGASMTARRLGRCRPGGPSGYDPVPE